VQGAISDCNALLALDPRHASAFALRGEVKRMLNDLEVSFVFVARCMKCMLLRHCNQSIIAGVT